MKDSDFIDPTFQVGYDDDNMHYINRTAIMINSRGAIFDDTPNGKVQGRLYVLIPWHRINYVAIDTGTYSTIEQVAGP